MTELLKLRRIPSDQQADLIEALEESNVPHCEGVCGVSG